MRTEPIPTADLTTQRLAHGVENFTGDCSDGMTASLVLFPCNCLRVVQAARGGGKEDKKRSLTVKSALKQQQSPHCSLLLSAAAAVLCAERIRKPYCVRLLSCHPEPVATETGC